jgi:hypothetical protein
MLLSKLWVYGDDRRTKATTLLPSWRQYLYPAVLKHDKTTMAGAMLDRQVAAQVVTYIYPWHMYFS